jgi:hypothetical protein
MPWPKWLGFGGKAKTPPKKSLDFDRYKRNADGTPYKPGDNLPKSRLGRGLAFAGGYALGAWDTPGGMLRGMVDKWVPTFSNRVTVRVQCAPRAFINDAYMLALSAAFGATKDLTYSSSNEITVTIDRTNKMVEVDLVYESSGLNTGLNVAASLLVTSGKDVIQAGVPDTVNGGDWPLWLKKNISVNPDLPLVGKPIATHLITSLGNDRFGANYTPRLDGMSRDNDLTTIVAAALLAGPCSSPAKPALSAKPSPPPPTLVSVPTMGSYVPNDGGIDTNRWSQLAIAGVTGAMPNWMPPNNYQTTGNG